MIKRILPPVGLLLALFFLWLGEAYSIFPPVDQILNELGGLLWKVGWFAIVLIAAFENIVFLNVYIPGSIVILGVMTSTAGDPLAAVAVFTAILLGQLIGLLISEYIGSKNYNVKGYDKSAKRIIYITLLLFCHPHSASGTAFALGAHQVRSRFMIIMIGCSIWSTFWGLLMYFGVGEFVRTIGWDYVTFIFAICWIIFEMVGGRPLGREGGTK
jgi:hypothetical protein